jgi:hypothetical protein
VLDDVSRLKGINARVIEERSRICSACGYGFEMDNETGLTACCGRKPASTK